MKRGLLLALGLVVVAGCGDDKPDPGKACVELCLSATEDLCDTLNVDSCPEFDCTLYSDAQSCHECIDRLEAGYPWQLLPRDEICKRHFE